MSLVEVYSISAGRKAKAWTHVHTVSYLYYTETTGVSFEQWWSIISNNIFWHWHYHSCRTAFLDRELLFLIKSVEYASVLLMTFQCWNFASSFHVCCGESDAFSRSHRVQTVTSSLFITVLFDNVGNNMNMFVMPAISVVIIAYV